MRSPRPILLVEDDQVDVMTVRRALRQLGIPNRLEVAGHGEQALDYLRAPDSEHPCIILLDLNTPRLSGIEFLEVVKQDPILCRIPVIVLTSSTEARDRVACFTLGVAGYMVKPINYEEFVEVIRVIDLYWSMSYLAFGG